MTDTQDAVDDRVEDRPEDGYDLPAELVPQVRELLEAHDRQGLIDLLDPLHEADIADLIEQLGKDERTRLIRTLGPDLYPETLTELEEGVRDEVLAEMDPAHLAAAVKELDTDDVVYLVQDLEKEVQRKLLDALEPVDRTAVETALKYDEYTAARMMRAEMVKAAPFWTVGQMIDFMRAADDLPEEFYDVVIVDPAMKPIGTVNLSKIMASPRPVRLEEIMEEDFRAIPATQSQADVAYAFRQYHMISAPVVDEDGRLIGVITMDDAMDALDEETDEDLKRLGGVGDEELSDRVWEITRRRFPWLAVNLLTAIVASLVIAQFDRVISAIVALAVLMPIVASMGGNAGTQTLTVAVRALATKDITAANAWRIIRREATAGFLNGAAFALIIGGIGYAWYGNPMLGVVLALAMIINLLIAGLAGILIPLGLEKAGADPALASGVFVTTVTDVVGFFAFLGLAAVLLL